MHKDAHVSNATAARAQGSCIAPHHAHRNTVDRFQASVQQQPTSHTCQTSVHNSTAIMDEIAPEYDVLVLGTGALPRYTATSAI